MGSSPEIIELLNDVLTAELTAINQYFVHAKIQDNWGYQRLAEKGREEAFGEMKHAEELSSGSSTWRVCPTCSGWRRSGRARP